MATILIAALSFVVGAITGAVALLAFAACATKDIEQIEHGDQAARNWKYHGPSDELIEGCTCLWRDLD
jgi:hypothetical protein